MNVSDVQQRSSISNASSYKEIGEFWDTHSLADYWDQTYEVEMEIRIPRRRAVNIEREMFDQVDETARRHGVSVETLVNLWIAERLHAPSVESAGRMHEEPMRLSTVKQLADESVTYAAE